MDSDRKSRLRFAILCDGRQLQLWQLKCLEHLRALAEVEPAAMLVSRTCGTVAPAGTLFRYFDKAGPESPAHAVRLPGYLADLPAVCPAHHGGMYAGENTAGV